MSAQCLSEYGLHAVFESDTMRVPAGADVDGGDKSLQSFGVKFWGEVLDREGKKVVNYKLPAQTAGALFDRQREGKKARRMRRYKSLPN